MYLPKFFSSVTFLNRLGQPPEITYPRRLRPTFRASGTPASENFARKNVPNRTGFWLFPFGALHTYRLGFRLHFLGPPRCQVRRSEPLPDWHRAYLQRQAPRTPSPPDRQCQNPRPNRALRTRRRADNDPVWLRRRCARQTPL